MKIAAPKIGWIGLGMIGTEMVLRLRSSGHDVTVYPRGTGLARVKAAGAEQCEDYAELAKLSDVLFLCVYSDAQLIDILFARGALAALRPGSTLIIHTTGSPETARRIAQEAPTGVKALDACFSGGPADVAAIRLTLMVGGDKEALEQRKPLLSCYASHIHHVGPPGQGQILKLLNNLLFATNVMNTAEIVALAERQGVSSQFAAEVIGTSSGRSYATDLLQFSPAASLMGSIRPYLQKDVATALAAAAAAGVDTHMFKSTAAYYQVDE
jgi:3-hydroxyisobutyrate dehydrogenase